MTTNNKHIMMIGLPETGKTTFLAALWYVVNNPDEVKGALKLHSLKGDKEHLNRIRDQWLEFLEMDRTNPSLQQTVSMELFNEVFSKRTKLYFPDISGEEFRQQVEDRYCDKSYFEWIENSNGALFFINCGSIERIHTIDELDELEEELCEEEPESERLSDETSMDDKNDQIVFWSKELTSQPAKLVDLFQIISTAKKIKKPFPVAIILSAWDLITINNNSPKTFVKNTFPLLYQYIESNKEIFNVTFFGVSAQGGKLEKKNEKLREKLAQETLIPSSRIIVKSEKEKSSDITIPIKWFMELDNE